MPTEPIIQGRRLGAEELVQIRTLLVEYPSWHRTRLSRDICARWDWDNEAGPPEAHGLPLALAQTPGPGATGAAATPASFGQSPAQPPRRRSAPRRGSPLRRVGGVAPRERGAGASGQPGGWVVRVPASALSLPGPAQLCRREPQIPGARAPRSD